MSVWDKVRAAFDTWVVESVTGAGEPPPPLRNGDQLIVYKTDGEGNITHWRVVRKPRRLDRNNP